PPGTASAQLGLGRRPCHRDRSPRPPQKGSTGRCSDRRGKRFRSRNPHWSHKASSSWCWYRPGVGQDCSRTERWREPASAAEPSFFVVPGEGHLPHIEAHAATSFSGGGPVVLFNAIPKIVGLLSDAR